MVNPRPLLPKVVRDLNEAGYAYALVGALAVSVRATERATKDIDFAVVVSKESDAVALLERLKQGRNYELLERNRDLKTNELRSAILAPGGPDGYTVKMDLLFRTCGIEREVVAAAEPMEIVPGVRLDVATTGHLIAMKTLSLDDVSRPRDRGDLADLLKHAFDADIKQAREALRLMQRRGYGFLVGKDRLQEELDQHCQLYAPHLMRDFGRSR